MPTRSKNNNEKSAQTRAQQKKKKPVNKKRKQKKGSIWKKIILSIVGLGVLGVVAGAVLFFYYVSSAPEIDRADLTDPVPSQILDIDGNVVKEVGAGSQNRELVSIEEIPQVLQDAVVSIEDQRFYDHIGVDPIRILGAAFANLQEGGVSQGGSTITQQLIKLSYFSTSEEDQTLKRKAQEAWMAIQLEQVLSKDEILALYINKVYMGNNAYGMGTAAEYYFGKELSDINLQEAATLAGLPQAPSYYDPYVNPEETKERRNIVLAMMVENEKITPEERNEALEAPVTENLVDHSNEVDYSLVIDSYLQLVVDEVYEKTGLEAEMGGLVIQTNLDMDAQQHLYDIVNTDEYVLFPDDEIQTAVTMVDVHTGAVQAVIGNRKNDHQMAVNYANQQNRDVASTIKPLIDYAPAIEYLNYSTGQTVVDEEYEFQDGNPLYNYDRLYKGDMTLRESLVDSRNVPAAKLLQEVGYDNASAFLSKLGIDASTINSNEDGLVESNAIRGDISSVRLAAAYAAFANGGTYYEPFTVRSVTDSEGKVYEFEPSGTQAMKESTAYMITDMLKEVITYSAPEAQIPGLPHAGKTGTSNFTDDELALVGAENVENVGKDSWFVGYSPNYAISVWLGYPEIDMGNYLTYETRNITRYIYSQLMSYASQDVETFDWVKPDSVVEATIEKYSKPLAKPGPNTPANMQITELFVQGTAPTQVSKKYGEAFKAPTGLKASYDQNKKELKVSWDAYALAEGDNRTPQFTVTVGGQSQTTTATEVTLANPAPGNVTISLVAKIGSTTSPGASITISIAQPEDEKDKEEKEEEKESSSESSSSSSEESSSESSAESSSQEESSESEAEEPEEPAADEETSEEAASSDEAA
ncbi:PBP1A family penicillin-binding protein [Jeotgalibaca caeni]|uniref:PBP1A family penicillin-binding protein n=1 Tax=Jeotgalibaca caeni TaxID=3028623 RepID=UPI00237EABCD|nr:PBP1A family penicillin-binding protein [Jeotgalibaca caeni]MDE1549068.1 PBP1A family penicillin-binding protein [Jeotgalibaca caeni]